METVRQTGRTLFGDNCAACHGSNAQGGNGFPNLTTASWLWGGDPESIAETIRVGINSAHPTARTSQMMAFGRDQLLKKDEVDNVVNYVRSLSDPAVAKDVPAAKIDAGKAVFAANCVTCHGDDAKGKADLGGAGPDRSILDLWRRRRVDLQDGVGRPARPDAELGGKTFAARPQDSCALSVRSPPGRTMSDTGAAAKPTQDKGHCLGRDRRRAVAGADRQFAPRLYGRRVATGLRRACAPGRGRCEGRKVQRGKVVMHAAMRLQGDRR